MPKRALGLLLVVALWPSTALAQDTARYRLDITITWSAATHPHEFPSGAHISRFVAVSHTGRYVMFGDGRTASSGLELVAENGRPDILMTELAEAIRRRRVFKIVVAPALPTVPAKTSLIIEVDRRRSRISFDAVDGSRPQASRCQNGGFREPQGNRSRL